ncbi:MAG: DUF805 domain-containing protein [Pseudomonadota bacterium]
MTPGQAITTSLRKSATFSGRAGRPEFWWTWGLLFPLVQLILLYRTLPQSSKYADIAMTLTLCALALPMISVGTRRLADAGVWRWFFVATFLFGVVAQLLYRIPVPRAGELDNLIVQFDDGAVPAAELGYYPFLRTLFEVMPWIGRPLALLCFILALLPTRTTNATE